MRLLKFKVNGQRIIKDPECDFGNIVAGTEGYLYAEFSFSKEWNGCKNIARFIRGGKEHAFILDGTNTCKIPSEVLTGRTFKVGILGCKEGYRITTNDLTIHQEVN